MTSGSRSGRRPPRRRRHVDAPLPRAALTPTPLPLRWERGSRSPSPAAVGEGGRGVRALGHRHRHPGHPREPAAPAVAGAGGLARRADGLDEPVLPGAARAAADPCLLVGRLSDCRSHLYSRQHPHRFQQSPLSDCARAHLPDRRRRHHYRYRARLSDRLFHRQACHPPSRVAADAGGLPLVELLPGARLRLEDDSRHQPSSRPRPGCTSPSARSGSPS